MYKKDKSKFCKLSLKKGVKNASKENVLSNENGAQKKSKLNEKDEEIPLSFDINKYFQDDNLSQFEIKSQKNEPNTNKNKNPVTNDDKISFPDFHLTNMQFETESNSETNNFPFSQSEFSQFYESSQVLKQLESVISNYDTKNHSQSLKSQSDFTCGNNKDIIKNVKQVLMKVKDTDEIDETESIEISQLFKSSQYKREISGLFDQLETTICEITAGQDVNLKKNDTDNLLTNTVINHDWENESLLCSQSMGSRIKQALMNNVGNSEKNTQIEQTKPVFTEIGPFYGLPTKIQDLIQQYKGIEKLYDWQDECLKLNAIKERKNLIYALPTSGGKTLVSEILIFREILCRRRNAIFVLPYVSIVQEKVWGLSPFALALNFLVEEYAAGKGHYPPRKRRMKQSVYIATIEKALGLINSLVETGRLHELGLIVVDELHLLGEQNRGASLEQLLTKVIHSEENIHIIGMSATIGNLPELCTFLNAEFYTNNFRPVELKEYVKCGNNIAEINRNSKSVDETLVPVRTVDFQYSEELNKIDPDRLGGLVMEVVPAGSCLVFCASKKNCENVALLLCRIMLKSLVNHNRKEKENLFVALKAEGTICPVLRRTIPFGVAYHHSGLTSDERRLIEDAFRFGTLCVICCTSTLAAGVNLPARRVILRSPYIGREFLRLARYKQMSGRAGRAGLGEHGESILICENRDLRRVIELLCSPMEHVESKMIGDDSCGLRNLVLSCIALGTATTRRTIRDVTSKTLLAVQEQRLGVNVKNTTDQVISDLFKLGAIQLETDQSAIPDRDISVELQSTFNAVSVDNSTEKSSEEKKQIIIGNDSRLIISKLGKAAIKGGLDLDTAHILYDDLVQAQSSLVLLNCLHLLYLVTPYDLASQMQPSLQNYYSIYIELGTKELQTARILGIDEACGASMMTGRRIKVKERILNRFYLTLILHELWNEKPVFQVADKFQVSRGIVQQLMVSSATFAANVVRFCEQLDELWAFAELLRGLGQRLQHCTTRELEPLLELPSVKQARARQLFQAGFKNLQSIARADPKDLLDKIEHMSRRVANQLIASAKLLLLERVENLREEAQDVLEGIDSTQHHF